MGTVKATVLIENVLASFEMEEILYELREHSAGLNCGIWDYSASFVNKFGKHVALISQHKILAELSSLDQKLRVGDISIHDAVYYDVISKSF